MCVYSKLGTWWIGIRPDFTENKKFGGILDFYTTTVVHWPNAMSDVTFDIVRDGMLSVSVTNAIQHTVHLFQFSTACWNTAVFLIDLHKLKLLMVHLQAIAKWNGDI